MRTFGASSVTMTVWAQARRLWPLILAVGGLMGLLVVLQPVLILYAAWALAALGALVLMAMLLLRSPEILFALFMSVGSFKASLLPLQERLGFDLTVALAILVIAGITIIVLRKRNPIQLHWPTLSIYLLLAGWMWFSIMWSPAQERGWAKSARFATLTLLAFVAPMFLLDTWSRLERFLGTLFLAGTVFTAAALIVLLQAGRLQRVVTVLGADYLTLGNVCGLTALLGIYFLIRGGMKWWLRLALLVCVSAAILMVFLGGARGPLVGWPLALLSPAILGRLRSREAFLALGIPLVGVVLFGGGWALGLLPYDVTRRFEVLFAAFLLGDRWAVRLVPRIHIWQVGLDMFLQHPFFGAGGGGYETSVHGVEVVYPHNLFLEAGAELGIVGLTLTLFLVVIPLVKWRRCSRIRLPIRHRRLLNMVLWVYSYGFVAVMKSGDFNTNRAFWMSVGIVISVCMLVTREIRSRVNAEVARASQQERTRVPTPASSR